MSADALDLWRRSTGDRFVIWLPLRKGMSFEAAARRAHQVVLAAHRGVGDCIGASDTQLTLDSNHAVRWRLYGDSIESVSRALQRFKSRESDKADDHG